MSNPFSGLKNARSFNDNNCPFSKDFEKYIPFLANFCIFTSSFVGLIFPLPKYNLKFLPKLTRSASSFFLLKVYDQILLIFCCM